MNAHMPTLGFSINSGTIYNDSSLNYVNIMRFMPIGPLQP